MFVDVFDPELPSLASDAAVELDLLLNGAPTEVESVHLLAKKLARALEDSSYERPVRSLQSDTALQNILGQAFAKSGDDPATVLANLMARTDQTVRELSSTTAQAEHKRLEWQRAFCLALSQSAASYQQMLVDLQPLHPDRR